MTDNEFATAAENELKNARQSCQRSAFTARVGLGLAITDLAIGGILLAAGQIQRTTTISVALALGGALLGKLSANREAKAAIKLDKLYQEEKARPNYKITPARLAKMFQHGRKHQVRSALLTTARFALSATALTYEYQSFHRGLPPLNDTWAWLRLGSAGITVVAGLMAGIGAIKTTAAGIRNHRLRRHYQQLNKPTI